MRASRSALAFAGTLTTALAVASSAAAAGTCAPGHASQTAFVSEPRHGVAARVRLATTAELASGQVAAWVGLGSAARTAERRARWLRAGIRQRPRSAPQVYVELKRRARFPRLLAVARVRPARKAPRLAIVAVPARPGLWRVSLDGRRIGRAVRFRGKPRGVPTVVAAQSRADVRGPCSAFRASAVNIRHWRSAGVRARAGTRVRLVSHGRIRAGRRARSAFFASRRGESAAGHLPKLGWRPPPLESPLTLTVGPRGGRFGLRSDRDYIVRIGAVNALGGVVLQGGRNVVVSGGHITIPWAGDSPSIAARRALFLTGQTGTVHIEGLLIDNEGGDLSEGIQIAAPKAVVQIQNVRIHDVHARDQVGFTDNHPDLIQPWGGVKDLRVHRLTGTTDCQGIFLKGDHGAIGSVSLRDVNLVGRPTARHLLWQHTSFPMALDNVWLLPAPDRALGLTVWPQPNHAPPRQAVLAADGSVSWLPETLITGSAKPGEPPDGDFVPEGRAGVGYVSPGYE